MHCLAAGRFSTQGVVYHRRGARRLATSSPPALSRPVCFILSTEYVEMGGLIAIRHRCPCIAVVILEWELP
jgi:hypothetical protein